METRELLKPDELERIERDHAGGLPVSAILEIFRPLGVQLSEATFRKYVQAGLLPRSRRVGRKGKHQGSVGLYPVEAVRRINAIKMMMAEGHTLEDIKRSFLFHRIAHPSADRNSPTRGTTVRRNDADDEPVIPLEHRPKNASR